MIKSAASRLWSQESRAKADGFLAHWLKYDCRQYQDVMEVGLQACDLREILPNGKEISDPIIDTPQGKQFKLCVKDILLSRWKIRRYRSLAYHIYEASIKTLIKQSSAAGVPLSRDGARALMDIHYRRK